jgi:transposase
VETNATRMCELLVGLPDVNVLGVQDDPGEPLRIHIELRSSVVGCPACGVVAHLKDRSVVELVDLPAFGRCARLLWHKRRFRCPDTDCAQGSFTEVDQRIGSPRMVMSDRAGRWCTRQVGKFARSVSEVASELGCDWHTINDAVVHYGTALVDDPDRYGHVHFLGLDEVLFVREGQFRRQIFSTQLVDVSNTQLLDVVAGRSGKNVKAWLELKERDWTSGVSFVTMDLSGPYRAVTSEMLPKATQVADPFHVVKLANQKLDEARRRVQNELFGHRGRKNDPLYRARRLLVMADERLDDTGRAKLKGLLEAGDPKGHVAMSWHAKEVVRSIYDYTNYATALRFVTRLGKDLQDEAYPPEVRSLGRTLTRCVFRLRRGTRATSPTDRLKPPTI